MIKLEPGAGLLWRAYSKVLTVHKIQRYKLPQRLAELCTKFHKVFFLIGVTKCFIIGLLFFIISLRDLAHDFAFHFDRLSASLCGCPFSGIFVSCAVIFATIYHAQVYARRNLPRANDTIVWVLIVILHEVRK
jgi:hypothetical protein